MRRRIGGALALLLLSFVPQPAAAVAADCSVWLVDAEVPTPARGAIAQVATVARNDVWAAGSVPGTDGDAHPAIFHWNGTTWSVRRFGTREGSLSAIDVAPDGTVWAVGILGARGLAITSVGGTWTRTPVGRRDVNLQLHAIDAGNGEEVWVVGQDSGGSAYRSIAFRWTGTGFARTPISREVPFGSYLSDVAIAGARVWAVGFQESGDPLVLRWSADRWRIVAFPGTGQPRVSLSEVESAIPGTVWIGGRDASGTERGSDRPILARWVRGTWTLTSSGIVPDPGYDAMRDSVDGLSALQDGSVLAAVTHIPLIDDDLGDEEGPPTIQVRVWNGVAWTLEATLEGEGIRASSADTALDGDAWVVASLGKPFEPRTPFVARRCEGP